MLTRSKMNRSAVALVLLALSSPAFADAASETMAILTAMKSFATLVTPLISVIAFVAGTFLFGATFMQMVNAHRGQGPLAHGDGGVKVDVVLVRCVIAACMMSFAFYGNNTIVTVFGEQVSADRALAYAPVARMASEQWTLAWGVVIVWIVMIGVVGMFRGLLLWNSAATESQGGGDYFWRGLWHIVGGAAAVNIGFFFG